MNKIEDNALAHAIEALNTDKFVEAFSSCVKQLAAFDNLLIIVYRGEHNPVVLYREWTDPIVYSPMDTQYVKSAYLLDPFYLEHLRGTSSGALRLVDIAPDRFKRCDYYRIYYKQTTLIDEVVLYAGLGNAMTLNACFGKDRSSGVRFSKKEIKSIKQYEMVLSALLKAHWKEYPTDEKLNKRLPALGERLRSAFERDTGIRLSPRQAEVASYILRGHSSMSIGLNLGISTETVKVFRRQLYSKCKISSQAELFSIMMALFLKLSENSE